MYYQRFYNDVVRYARRRVGSGIALDVVAESAVMSTYGGGRWCWYGTVSVGAESIEFDLGSGDVVKTPVYTHPSSETGFYAYCSIGNQPVMRMKVLRTHLST